MRAADAEADLFQALLAVAEGGSHPSRTSQVQGLVLRGLAGATDRVVAEALSSLRHLRCALLFGCVTMCYYVSL
jgi:hypothetical protein